MQISNFYTFFPVLEATLVKEFPGTIGVPYMDISLLQHISIGAAFDEPEQFLRYPSPKYTFCSQQGKSTLKRGTGFQ